MNYLNEMIRRNTRDMLRRNWGKAVALTVTVMAVLLLGSMPVSYTHLTLPTT